MQSTKRFVYKHQVKLSRKYIVTKFGARPLHENDVQIDFIETPIR